MPALLSVAHCVCGFHPGFTLGQYALNQRSFFEWIGRANTFALPVPSYASGIRELRQGWNSIVLITDGLLEHGTRVFVDPQTFYTWFTQGQPGSLADLEANVERAVRRIHREHGRDSATVIAWSWENQREVSQPT